MEIAIPIVALVLIFGPPLLLVAGGILIVIIAMMKGASSKPGKLNGNEVRAFQEMHRGLARMEDRLEALETIVLEQKSRPKERSQAES